MTEKQWFVIIDIVIIIGGACLIGHSLGTEVGFGVGLMAICLVPSAKMRL